MKKALNEIAIIVDYTKGLSYEEFMSEALDRRAIRKGGFLDSMNNMCT